MFKSVWFILLLIFSVLPGTAVGQEKAPPSELVQYIRDARKAGLTDAQIERNAVTAGWGATVVKDAIESLKTGAKPRAASGNEPKTSQPKTDSKVMEPAPVVDKDLEKDKDRGTAPASSTPQTPPTGTAPTGQPSPATAPPTTPPTASSEPTTAKAAATTQEAASVRPPVQRNVPDEYKIGEGDVIQVNVWGERDASVGSVVVRPDGMITMPLIKDIRVSGLTPAEAEQAISEPLSKLIKAADVTVIVNQINSKKVFMVGGGVKKEGPIPYTYRMTVMQAISEAGGLTDYAKRKKIYVLRNENGRQFKLPFDYDAVLKGERMELNIPLMPGDTLVIPNH